MNTQTMPLHARMYRWAIRYWPTDAGIGRLIWFAPSVSWENGNVFVSLRIHPLRLLVDPNTFCGKALYYRGTYEEASLTLLRRLLRPAMTFVDVGANVGLYTVVAAHAVGTAGHVVAIEPQSSLLDACAKNCRLNAVDEQVILFPVALAANAGSGTLHQVSRTNNGQATLRLTPQEQSFYEPMPVELRTLGSLLSEQGLHGTDGMKIDVEGAELEVLKSYNWNGDCWPEFIFVECIDKHLQRFAGSAKDLFTFLLERDYVMACRYRGRWRQFKTLDEHRRCGLSSDCIALRKNTESWKTAQTYLR